MFPSKKHLLFSLPLVLLAALLVHGAGETVNPDLAMSRSNACAVALPDGRVAILGGTGTAGALASTVFYDQEGRVTEGASMAQPRYEFTCALLPDGRLLAAGGRLTGGAVTSATEIYDPAKDEWQGGPNLPAARAGATASVLKDGRILFAGGDLGGAVASSLEIYDPAAGAFSPVLAQLSNPRKLHGAAVLGDGRVIFAGGTNGQAPLATVEIFDPASGQVSPAGHLSMPRVGLTATPLPGGRVVFLGGTNGVTEVDLAEVYNPKTGEIAAEAATMLTPRQGHIAVRLPDNNTVLIAGGSANSAVMSSPEIYTPWRHTFRALGASTTTGGTTMAVRRTARTFDLANSAASTVAAGYPTIKTDKEDYAPGTPVYFSGASWTPGATVLIKMTEDPYGDDHPTIRISVDALGNLITASAVAIDDAGNVITQPGQAAFAPDINDVGVTFYVVATEYETDGNPTGLEAATSFTDNISINSATVETRESTCTTLTTTFTQGQTACANVLVTAINGNGNADSFFIIWFNPSGTAVRTTTKSAGLGTFTDTLGTAGNSPVGTWTVSVCKTTGCNGGNRVASTTFTLATGAGTSTTTSVGSSANPSVYGQAVSFTATISPSAATGSVQFVVDGVNFGSPVTVSSGSATSGSTSSLTVPGPHTVTANFTGTGSYANSSGTLVSGQMVNKATPTATLAVNNSPQVYTGSGLAATVTVATSSVPGTVSTVLTGGAATQTTVGTYAVTANFVPADTTNYNTLTGVSAGNFVINKATPTATLAVNNSPQVYTGSGLAATVAVSTSSVPGAPSTVLTGGAATQTTVGTYAVTANFVPADTTNYNTLTGVSAGNFVISKATPTATLAVNNSPQVYTGSGLAATVTVSTSSVPGAPSTVLTGGAATQTTAGTYAVTANFVPADTTNYNTLTGVSAGNFVINKAPATMSLSNLTQIYTGSALTPTATTNPVGLGVTWTNAPQIDAGGYQVTATVNDANYTGSASGQFVIGPASAIITVTPYSVTFDGAPHTATGTAYGVGGVDLSSGLDLSHTTHTSAGDYPSDTFTFNAGPNYNTISNGIVHNAISKYSIPACVSAGCGLDNSSHLKPGVSVSIDATSVYLGTVTATVKMSPVVLGTTGSLNLQNPSDPTTRMFAVYLRTVDPNNNNAPSGGTTLLGSGTATQITDSTGTYYQTTITAALPAGIVPDTYEAFVYGDDAGGGVVTADAGYTVPDTNDYIYPTVASANLVVSKATATVTLSNLTQTYTGSPLTPTATTSPAGLTITWTGAPQSAAGSYQVTATVNDPNYQGSASGTFVINKATPTATLEVNNSPQVYTGSGLAATVAVSTSSVPGTVSTVLTGGAATQTTVGTYPVTANFVPADTTNYNTLTGISAGNFVINKATPTATLAVNNSPQVYTGSGLAATVTVATSSVPGTVSTVLTGGAATQTTAGTYAVTANFVPTDTTNYNTLTGVSAGNFVINKATPTATLAVNNSPQVYTGSGLAATVTVSTSSVPGTVSTVLTGGAATQTTVGTYPVTANFVPADTTNYNTLTGISAGNFVINKATPTATLAVNNSPQVYTGSGLAATVTVATSSVPGTVSTVLTGGAATQTTAGTYAVTANFVPADTTNYNTLTGVSAGNFVINKATPTATLEVNNSPQVYTGSGLAATVTVSTSSVPGTVSTVLTGGAATQTTVGTYAVTANFVPADTTNYNTLTGVSAGNFVISKATPTATLAVSNSPQVYTGSGLAATVTVSTSSVPGTVSNVLTGGAATQTTVGTYAVTASFVPADTTNYNTLTGVSAGNFVISQAPSYTVVTGGVFTYDTLAHPATVHVTGAGGLNLSPAPTYSGGCVAAPVNVSETTPAPCTASYVFSGDLNHTGSNGSVTITINQAPTVTTVTAVSYTYDGGPHGETAGVTGPGLSLALPAVTYTGTLTLGSVPYGPTNTPPANPGSFTASATYGGGANWLPSAGSSNFTITIVDGNGDGIPDFISCSILPQNRVVYKTGTPLGTMLEAVLPASRLHASFQAAAIAASDNDVISMYASTTENVIIGDTTGSGGKDLRIIGCGQKITGALLTKPVITVEVSAGANDGNTGAGEADIHIDDVNVLKGSIGFLIQTSKGVGGNNTSTLLKSIRSDNNTGGGLGIGVKIQGDGNEVRGANSIGSNTPGDGIQVIGNSNLLNSNRVMSNKGDGIDVTGNSNTIVANKVGEKGTGNQGNGIVVNGASNTLNENDVFASTLLGIKVTGNLNEVYKNDVGEKDKGNKGGGILITGDNNLLGKDLSENNVFANTGVGIAVAGNDNMISKNDIGDGGKGNSGDGLNVSGYGNTINENNIFANGGDGIEVSGGTAAKPNILVKNDVGDRGKGNLGNGILAGGTGSGVSNPVELQENTVKSNKLIGISISGTGQQLFKNESGGSGAYPSGEKNGGCAYNVVAGNLNATGNVANDSSIAGANGSAFPTGCTNP